jgi:hypothetical protein
LVIEGEICFSGHLSLESPISVSRIHLYLGDLTINTADAELWSPRPDWERLHARRDGILNQLMKLQIADYQVRGLDMGFDRLSAAAQPYSTTGLKPLISNLPSALTNADISSAKTITSQLAGIGAGLTPAGDDFILGAIYAAWIIHPPEVAKILAEEIASTAAPLTASLSAAWLRSAGRGEAGVLWHEFFDALLSDEPVRGQIAMDKILGVGATSGADALAGFMGTLRHQAKLVNPKIS